jgi:6-phosphogluconolactonase
MSAATHPSRLFVGTYTRAGSRGIYSVALRPDGSPGEPALAAESPNPTFLALSPDKRYLYAVASGPGWASSFRIDPVTLGLTPVQRSEPDERPTPCHISVNAPGTLALAANYHLGLAALIPLGPEGSLGAPMVVAHSGHGPDPVRQASPHVHSAFFTPGGRQAAVCDLGLDRIYNYTVDPEAGLVAGTPAFTAAVPGAGPRHLAFSSDGRHAFVINELGNTIVTHALDTATGALTPKGSVTVLPAGYSGTSTAAEIRVHPNGRFVYGSARGPDTIAVFGADPATGALTPVETVPCGGKGPRGFALSPDGAWLVCAHQESGTLCTFSVDPGTGRLRRVSGAVSVSTPVCVVFLD